jgi:GDPmannose 4,6-dehydratase
MKRALITGISGMDGSHMADLLLAKDYLVFGLERHKSSGGYNPNTQHLRDKVEIVKGDLADSGSLRRALEIVRPDEVYNFAAQSFVGDSWTIAEHTANITGMGVLRLLEAIRTTDPEIKLVQASSSEMFGILKDNVANEQSSFYPRSPYGCAKVFAHHMVEIYRKSYNMFACSSICFNHESERRGHQFVTRKISDAVARIHLGMSDTLALGNLRPRRDWGYAPEYMEGIWRMLQQDTPEDFVFASGQSNSVEEFVQEAFNVVGIQNWQDYVVEDTRFMRPVEVNYLRGDYSKAKELLGWEPKVLFSDLVQKMVENDLKLLRE